MHNSAIWNAKTIDKLFFCDIMKTLTKRCQWLSILVSRKERKMRHVDLFQEAIDRGDYVEAARLAIQFGRGKGSRAGAWNWADDAVKAAAQAGISLDPGHLSWPDFDRMEQQLEGGTK
jgi:hypothetical protein